MARHREAAFEMLNERAERDKAEKAKLQKIAAGKAAARETAEPEAKIKPEPEAKKTGGGNSDNKKLKPMEFLRAKQTMRDLASVCMDMSTKKDSTFNATKKVARKLTREQLDQMDVPRIS